MTLPVSRLVRVSVNLSPLAAAARSFGVLMIAGDSNVISGIERYRTYGSYEEVTSDFGTSAPESLAAQLYFGQTPQPQNCMIGRWLRTATSAQNDGGILNSSEQLLTLWQSITSGGFQISIDGSNQSLTGLNFSAISNLNGAATIISGALSGSSCVFNGSQFIITSASTGAGAQATGLVTFTANPSYGAQATNTIGLTGQPSAGDTVTVNGTAITFETSSPTGNQVMIGVDQATTLANLLNFLQNSPDVNVSLMTYNSVGSTITATARLYGTAGNAYTLAKSGANITIGAGTFAGGVNADTLTINGTAFTFVHASPSGNQILVGATKEITASNTNTVLNASVVSGVALSSYSVASNLLTVTYKTTGTAGNAFTLARSSSAITVSGATLSGGSVASSVGYATAPVSGQDISAMLKMTSSLSAGLVPGFSAEQPVDCAAALANISSAWFGLMFAASVPPNDSQNLAVCAFIEAQSLKRIFGVTITNTNVLVSTITSDLASQMALGGYLQSFNQYSENAYAIASFFGRAFSVNFLGNNSTITLMYKQEPSVVPENLTTTQADTLKAKRCNVFTSYVNNTAIIQYAVMSGLAYFDEIHGMDWLQDAIQNACYNLLYTSVTKIPQTDSGVNQLVNAISGACNQAVSNGLAAPGIWNGPSFGQLQTGQYLKQGYYIYAQPLALQSQSDRDARVAPPITVGIKLAGAIQEVNVIVDVNR